MKKKIIAILIILPIVVLFTLWYYNKQQNEKQLAQDLAMRFDETMKATYPLLSVTNTALYRRADIWEENATAAYRSSPYNYKETFRYLNSQSFNTYRGTSITMCIEVYKFFLSSAACGHLYHGGDLREKESLAVYKILYAYQNPSDPIEMEYEELIEILHKTKKALSESTAELIKYKAGCGKMDDWRYVDPIRYQHIHERYKSKKNWPFTFLNVD